MTRPFFRWCGSNPGTVLSILLSLSLGIGLCVSAFALLNGIFLQPLPYSAPESLVQIGKIGSGAGLRQIPPSELGLIESRKQLFDQVAAYTEMDFDLSSSENGSVLSTRVQGAVVEPRIFPLLGVPPSLGRWLGTDDRDTVVLSQRLWATRFGKSETALGSRLEINRRRYLVVGIMPEAFSFPEEAEAWVPGALDAAAVANVGAPIYQYVDVVARLAAQVSPADAREVLKSDESTAGLGVEELKTSIVGTDWRILVVLFVSVLLVLSAAVANSTSLLMARASAKERDFAVRAALGASRAKLMLEAFREPGILTLLSGLAGLALGSAAVRLVGSAGFDLPRLNEVRVGSSEIVFGVLVALVAALLPCIASTVHLLSVDANAWLRSTGRASGRSFAAGKAQAFAIVLQTSMALILFYGLVLTSYSFHQLWSLDLGFARDHLATVRLTLTGDRYRLPEQRTRLFEQVVADIHSLPGFLGVSAIDSPPVSGGGFRALFRVVGQTYDDKDLPAALCLSVMGDYFRTMHIDVLQGRAFGSGADSEAQPTAIVDESFVRRHLSGVDPLDQSVELNGVSHHIVGVVRSVQTAPLGSASPAQIYVPYQQSPFAWFSMQLLTRTEGDPSAAVGMVRQRIRSFDPDIPLDSLQTMDNRLSRALAPRRLTAFLLAAFSLITLLLTAFGIYSLLSYFVEEHRSELGVRMALGAGQKRILGFIAGKALRWVLAGIPVGIAGAYFLGHYLDQLLYNISPESPFAFLLAAQALLLVALFACLLPALRASKRSAMDAILDR